MKCFIPPTSFPLIFISFLLTRDTLVCLNSVCWKQHDIIMYDFFKSSYYIAAVRLFKQPIVSYVDVRR